MIGGRENKRLSAIPRSADWIWVGCDEQPLGGCEVAAKF